jgi:hypothetical protein
LPIKIDKFRDYLQTNVALFKTYFGDNKHITVEEGMVVTGVKIKQQNIEGRSLSVFEVSVGFQHGGGKTYRLGALSIMESMAKIITKHLYPRHSVSTLLQYHLAEMLVDHMYPAYGKDKANVIALCDVSLLHYHPAEIFFRLLNMMKQARFLPSKSADVYKFALKNISLPEGSRALNLIEMVQLQSPRTIKQVNDLFPSTIFKGIGQWGGDMINKAVQQRLNKYDFIPQLLTMSRTDAKKFIFDDMMRNIGVPLIFNNAETCWTLHYGDDLTSPLSYRAMYEVYCLLRYGRKKTGCMMKKGCNLSSNKIDVDETCDNAPWKRVKRQELCPFAQAWRLWGLEGMQPILTA